MKILKNQLVPYFSLVLITYNRTQFVGSLSEVGRWTSFVTSLWQVKR